MGFTPQVSNRVESESIVWTRLLYIIWLIGLENSTLSQYPGLMDVVFFSFSSFVPLPIATAFGLWESWGSKNQS